MRFRAVTSASGGLLLRVALQFMKFNTVQLLKPLVAELAGVVIVGFRGVLLHVPVQRCTLATLVATDFTLQRCFSCVSPPVNFQVILTLK